MISIPTRLFITGLALACLPAAADPKPNILFIMVDEMKWNVMSCEGHPFVKTPNLDRLAREGTRFATAYTVAPICTPSRYSAFTARYAHVHGSTDNSTPPREPQLLLPPLLKHSGYQTAISGKLHYICPSDIDYGFDFFWSFGNEGPGKLPSWPRFMLEKYQRAAVARRLEAQPFPDDSLGRDLGKLTYPVADSQTSWITARALDFLGQRDASKPFFLFVSYLDPHSPSHLCEPYWSMATNTFKPATLPLPPTFKQDPSKQAATAANRHEVNDPEIVRAMTAAYYAKVTMVDDNVGQLLDALRAKGLADSTLIVFTADHGNMLGDLNRWFKGAMYEGSTRIPLLMKAPPASPYAAAFNCGAVVSNIVQNIDVMPTLCEIAGVPLPERGVQGRSLAGLVAGKSAGWRDCAYSERGNSMVRTPQYKLVRNEAKDVRRGGAPYELYDLTRDPQETHDLSADPAYSATLKELAARLDAWQNEAPPVPSVAGVDPLPQAADLEKKVEKAKRKRR
jgi:choline-sulfatase